MTKEGLIKMICATWIKDENGMPFILDYNAVADSLLVIIEQEKNDTLKAFTEYIEDRLNILIKDQHHAAEIAKAENDLYKMNMSWFMADTIEVIKDGISHDLENFLKEKK